VREVPLSSSSEARKIVEEAYGAQRAWRNTDLQTRLDLVSRFSVEFDKIGDKVADEITAQMGKPLQQSKNEINGFRERTNALLAMAPEVLAPEVLPEKSGLWRRIVKEPVGVVLVIAPWNYPLLTAVNSLVPSILAGNSVILKHSPLTPLVAEALVQAFSAAGAPKGLVSVLHAPNEVVAEVIEHERLGFVAFTGSVEGGRQVHKHLVEHRFIDSALELGGKDPAYIAADANLEYAVASVVDGAFYNAGQSCCSIERAYVHSSLYNEFVEKALTLVREYVIGDPMSGATTLGPVALSKNLNLLERQVQDAKDKGASVLHGGSRTKDASGNGQFFCSLISNANHDMEIMREESFGPVLPIMSVKSDEEALRLMNDSRYGLTAAVYTKDLERAQRIGAEIEAGTVFMNRCDYLDPELPWTGVKDSGKGVSLSRHGWRGVVRLKGYNFKIVE